MVAGIILVTGLLLLASEYVEHLSRGSWRGMTIESLFGVPADYAFTGWALVDKVLQFPVRELELWTILLCVSGLAYWVADFTAEKFRRVIGQRRSASDESALLHPVRSLPPPDPPLPQATA